MANPRFDGEYDIFIKSRDKFGGECHCKGSIKVQGSNAEGTVQLDPSKNNSWYCINKALEFSVKTHVEDDNNVHIEATVYGKSVKTKATFENKVDHHQNSFKTSVMAHTVTGTTQKKAATTPQHPKPSPLGN